MPPAYSEKSKCGMELPRSIIDSLARHLVPEILKYYDSEEGGIRRMAGTAGRQRLSVFTKEREPGRIP